MRLSTSIISLELVDVVEAQLEALSEQEYLLQQYKLLSRQLGEAKRAGRDLAPLKAEHKRVYDRLQELAPRKVRSNHAPAPQLRTEVVTAPADLQALRQEWDDLLARADNYSPFLTWEWWWPWVRHFGHLHQPYLILARDQDNRLLGGLPLALMSDKLLGFMGSRSGPDPAHLGVPLHASHRTEALQALMERVAADCGKHFPAWRWDQCAVDGQLGDILSAAARAGLQANLQVKRHYVHGDLPDTFDAYVSNVPNKNRRNYLRNQFERLEREWARPVLRVFTEASHETVDTIAQMAQYNIRRRQTLGDYSRWNAPAFSDCLDDVIQLFSERNWLRLYTLTIEGRLAAALLGWAYRGTFFAYQIGETDEHPDLGLGQCVISYAIKGSIEEGLKRFEFLGEAHPFKQTYFPGLTGAATVLLGRDDCAYWSRLGWSSLRRAVGRRLRRAGVWPVSSHQSS
ncbi:MAG: GNAT family N-acetyltransferase [Armatimonadia bacterium]